MRQFFAASDPAWRWVLILGLRDLRANAARLGELANSEIAHESWSDDAYVYGPLINGLTAAAVNECAQHCEDLFAVLKFLREEFDFAKRMSSYGAGTVTRFGLDLSRRSDEETAGLFLVPSLATVRKGLEQAEDPEASFSAFEGGVRRLSERLRRIIDWYAIYEDFHVQYKHGLKLAMRPYGNPTAEAIEEHRADVSGALFAFTTEPIARMRAGPEQQQGMIFPNLIPEAREHLNALVAERAILRYKMSGPPVDLDDVVGVSRNVFELLRIAATNRLAVSDGLDENGQYRFDLPGESSGKFLSVLLELETAPSLGDFPK
ncbi:MAG: hypothetical protein JST08_00330 [Actinobacteria bacterium]|nr:hypothetical protein [Actinomycetota bacterium]